MSYRTADRFIELALLEAIDGMAETDVSPALLGTPRWCYASTSEGRFLMDHKDRIRASDKYISKSELCSGIVDGSELTLYVNEETPVGTLKVMRTLEIPEADISRILDSMTQPPAGKRAA